MLTTDEIVKLSLQVGYTAVTEDAYSAGLILGSTETITASNRVKKYSAIAGVAEDFPSGDIYNAAALYFSQTPAPDALLIGCIAENETPVEALTAVLEKTGAFWGVYVVGATNEQVLALDTFLSARDNGMLFFATTEYDAAVADNGIFKSLFGRKTKRVCAALTTAAADAAAVMGRSVGLGANANGAFSLCYKSVTGITPVAGMNATKTAALKALNANAYVTRGYNYVLFEHGATPNGLRVDEVYYLDRMASDLQDAVLGVMVDSPSKLPQTDEGSTVISSVVKDVLTDYVGIGFLGAGVWRGSDIGGVSYGDTLDNGYVVEIDSYADQSQADREAHKAMPVRIGVTLAGSVESVEINLYAQV